MKSTFKPTKELIHAAKFYLFLLANFKLIEQIERGFENQLLASRVWLTEQEENIEQERIENPKYAWRMSNQDFAEYVTLISSAMQEKGFSTVIPNNSPLTEIEYAKSHATFDLIKKMEPFSPIKELEMRGMLPSVIAEYVDSIIDLLIGSINVELTSEELHRHIDESSKRLCDLLAVDLSTINSSQMILMKYQKLFEQFEMNNSSKKIDLILQS